MTCRVAAKFAGNYIWWIGRYWEHHWIKLSQIIILSCIIGQESLSSCSCSSPPSLKKHTSRWGQMCLFCTETVNRLLNHGYYIKLSNITECDSSDPKQPISYSFANLQYYWRIADMPTSSLSQCLSVCFVCRCDAIIHSFLLTDPSHWSQCFSAS